MFGVKSMWYGENGKVSVITKEKGYTDDLVRN